MSGHVDKRYNKVPDTFSISLFDLIVLYINVLKAKESEDIGYESVDETFTEFINKLKAQRVYVPKKDLEAALWACIMLDEHSDDGFWHPTKTSMRRFINALIQHKQLKYYFDKFYCMFIAKKPKSLKREVYSSQVGEGE